MMKKTLFIIFSLSIFFDVKPQKIMLDGYLVIEKLEYADYVKGDIQNSDKYDFNYYYFKSVGDAIESIDNVLNMSNMLLYQDTTVVKKYLLPISNLSLNNSGKEFLTKYRDLIGELNFSVNIIENHFFGNKTLESKKFYLIYKIKQEVIDGEYLHEFSRNCYVSRNEDLKYFMSDCPYYFYKEYEELDYMFTICSTVFPAHSATHGLGKQK